MTFNLIHAKTQFDYRKYINYVIIAYAFFLPISRAGISILTVLMIVLWIVEGDFKRKFNQLKENKVVIALVVFILYTFLSLFWTQSANIEHGAGQSFKIVRLVFLPMIVIATTLKYEYIPKVITAFLLGMLISETISYGIYFEWWQWKNILPHDPTPFMHHLDYSTFLAFTSLLLFNRFFETSSWGLKSFYFVYFLFVASNLFISGGRTGQLAFVVAIFVVGLVNIQNRLKALVSIFALVTFIFSSAYLLTPNFSDRFDSVTDELHAFKHDSDTQLEGSFGQRVGAWIVGFEMFKDNPLFGTGGGSEMVEYREYVKEILPNEPIIHDISHFHNEYVHTVVEYGTIGLILYLIVWYQLYKMPIKNSSFSNLRMIFITVFSIASLVELIFHNQFPMSLFALFVGVFVLLNLQEKGENR